MDHATTGNRAVEQGRQSFKAQSWHDAFAYLTAADNETPLDVADLERLAVAAYMVGEHAKCAMAWTRAEREWISRSEPVRAARCSFWQACGLFFRGESAPGKGWVARGRRVLDEYGGECPERAWLLALTALSLIDDGDTEGAAPLFAEASAAADGCSDPDILVFVRVSYGFLLVNTNRAPQGLALLDEAMVAVTAGEVSPIMAGACYCMTIGTCQAVLDLRRAREWTVAFTRWCESQSGLISFQGNCLVNRCEVLRLQGAWPEALEVAARAFDELLSPDMETIGSAHYQVAEIQRLRGDLPAAEESYRRASQAGREPEPGMSLLRLAQGRAEAAAAAIRRVLDETEGAASRSKILPAHVEIMLAIGAIEDAEAGAAELASIASAERVPFVQALAAHARGAVLLAQGDHRQALNALRDACKRLQELEAPYEAARVRLLISEALRGLGDGEGAALELDGARWALQQLGATAWLQETGDATPAAPGGLTTREAEVLALLAAGKTNREISSALVISEHTVARHVQNVFAKIGVSSRAAAIAFAFENGLVRQA